MAANLHYDSRLETPAAPASLGPRGPFPDAPLTRDLERRWLHYAFLSRDHRMCLVSNASLLGPTVAGRSDEVRNMTIVLLHQRGAGWRASQYNAHTSVPLWSAFRQPHPPGRPGGLTLASTDQRAGVRLDLTRTGRPCTSQCAPLGHDQHFRWQSEAGVLAKGAWDFDGNTETGIDAVGYHERVRGHWDWHDLGGWVFGFANDTAGPVDAAPPAALVFTLVQPRNQALTTGSVMLWRHGRLRRHFPRRNVSAAVRGELNRDAVTQVPALSELLGVAPTAPVPRQLVISAHLGPDHVLFDFVAETAARIVIPSETGLAPFSVHEAYGPCRVEGRVSGDSFCFESFGIVEFAGGAGVD